jgi:hypothetical protein
MGIIKNGVANTLQLFALDQAGAPIAQVAPWPKVSISRVSAPIADLVTDASMTIKAAGEFVYAWTPLVVGQYRAKYEMKNGATSVFAYEDFDSQVIVGELAIGDDLVGTIEDDSELTGEVDPQDDLIGTIEEN